jgi:NADH-quinone oxidoreductase subunit M
MLGVDGISLLLVLLTTFLTPIVLLSSFKAVEYRVKEYMIAFLALETGMLGALMALDIFLFYIFWEFMLIPMYLIIGVWGGKNRVYATIKFVIFTMVGSLLMLVGIIYLYVRTGASTFLLSDIIKGAMNLTATEQLLLFGAFGLAFAIKVPIFPFHTWLPDAHTEAPTAGSVILAGVLLKMGTYGFLRFGLPLFPYGAYKLTPLIFTLAVIGVIYGAMVSFVQKDIKRLVAFSSVSHLGFVMVGMMAMTPEGIQGSLIQMINHGISTGGLFLAVGVLYERRHTRLIEEFGGIAGQMPLFAAFFMIVMLSSAGLPGLNGFIGEFLVISGTIKAGLPLPDPGPAWYNNPFFNWNLMHVAVGVLTALGVILGAVYLLTAYRKVMFGPLKNEKNKNLPDMNLRECLVGLPIILMAFVIGIYPKPFLDPMLPSVNQVIAHVDHYRRYPEMTEMEKKRAAQQRPEWPFQLEKGHIVPSINLNAEFDRIKPQLEIHREMVGQSSPYGLKKARYLFRPRENFFAARFWDTINR